MIMKSIFMKNSTIRLDSKKREQLVKHLLKKIFEKYEIDLVSQYAMDVLGANYHLIMYEEMDVALFSSLGITLLALGMNNKFPLTDIVETERRKNWTTIMQEVIRVILRVLEAKEMAGPKEVANLESILADNYK